jgi:hypothetical protein
MLPIGLLVDTLLRCPSPLTLFEENTLATIQIVRKPEEPKVVNLRDEMKTGQWGTGTLRTGAATYDAVIALQRGSGFLLFVGKDFAPRNVGLFTTILVITEILSPGTQVVITL